MPGFRYTHRTFPEASPCPACHPHTPWPSSLKQGDHTLLPPPAPPPSQALRVPDSPPGEEAPTRPIPASRSHNPPLANGRRDRHRAPAAPHPRAPTSPLSARCAHGPADLPPHPSCAPLHPHTWGTVIRGAGAHRRQDAQEEQRPGRRPGSPQAGQSAHGGLGSPWVLAALVPGAPAHTRRGPAPSAAWRTGSREKAEWEGPAGACPVPSLPIPPAPHPLPEGRSPRPPARRPQCAGPPSIKPLPVPARSPQASWYVLASTPRDLAGPGGERTGSRCGAGDARPIPWGRG